jgi:hypothetical protein
MMDLKLTPVIILVAILLLALAGPADKLALLEGQPHLMGDAIFWRDVAASAVSTIGKSYEPIVTIIATAFGIPMLRRTVAPPK